MSKLSGLPVLFSPLNNAKTSDRGSELKKKQPHVCFYGSHRGSKKVARW